MPSEWQRRAAGGTGRGACIGEGVDDSGGALGVVACSNTYHAYVHHQADNIHPSTALTQFSTTTVLDEVEPAIVGAAGIELKPLVLAAAGAT